MKKTYQLYYRIYRIYKRECNGCIPSSLVCRVRSLFGHDFGTKFDADKAANVASGGRCGTICSKLSRFDQEKVAKFLPGVLTP